VIRFSAALVAVAIGVLIGGIATSKLLLVYTAVGISAVALVTLGIGVALKRKELFGEGPGLEPAAAAAGPGRPDPAADGPGASQPGVDQPGAGQQNQNRPNAAVTPPPPLAGTAVTGYGAPGAQKAAARSQPVSSPAGTGFTGLRSASAGPGRAADPVPPWEPQATSVSWLSAGDTPDWVRARTAPAAERAPGGWGARDSDEPGHGTAPQAWAAPSPSPAPPRAPEAPPAASVSGASGSSAPAYDPQPAAPSWFERLGKPAASTASAAAETAPATGNGWSRPGRATAAPEETAAPGDAPAAAGIPGDEDDDWPARYSWLDDETDQEAEPADSAAATSDAGTPAAAQSFAADEPDAAATQPESDELTEHAPETPHDPPAEPDAGDRIIGETADETEGNPAADPATAQASGLSLVTVIRGVPRFHEPDCVLIRFMPDGDTQKLTIPEAEKAGCTPCTACQPTG
jgi:hypothetical protein